MIKYLLLLARNKDSGNQCTANNKNTWHPRVSPRTPWLQKPLRLKDSICLTPIRLNRGAHAGGNCVLQHAPETAKQSQDRYPPPPLNIAGSPFPQKAIGSISREPRSHDYAATRCTNIYRRDGRAAHNGKLSYDARAITRSGRKASGDSRVFTSSVSVCLSNLPSRVI